MEANTRRIESYKSKFIKSPNILQNLLMFIDFINNYGRTYNENATICTLKVRNKLQTLRTLIHFVYYM